ncbi:MAG: putative signal transduction protein with domain [Deltaproteobacteria bacterium]|nr:putative signal transduction protein with domain [Deltaproteobacteria bacterium]
MSLRTFCQKRVVTISPERSVAEACWLMKEKNVGCLIAENHGKLCGIITDRDIALKVTGEEKDPLTTMVQEIMTSDPVRISVDKDLPELVSLMHSRHVRRVPIVDQTGLTLGIVTLDDLIALFGYEMSALGKAVSEGFRPATA